MKTNYGELSSGILDDINLYYDISGGIDLNESADDHKELTYDIIFNDDENSNGNGFKESLEYCKDYIEHHNGTDWSYFADYKGGIVQIVCNETDEIVYTAEVL
jgi:hypothetical protein